MKGPSPATDTSEATPGSWMPQQFEKANIDVHARTTVGRYWRLSRCHGDARSRVFRRRQPHCWRRIRRRRAKAKGFAVEPERSGHFGGAHRQPIQASGRVVRKLDVSVLDGTIRCLPKNQGKARRSDSKKARWLALSGARLAAIARNYQAGTNPRILTFNSILGRYFRG